MYNDNFMESAEFITLKNSFIKNLECGEQWANSDSFISLCTTIYDLGYENESTYEFWNDPQYIKAYENFTTGLDPKYRDGDMLITLQHKIFEIGVRDRF